MPFKETWNYQIFPILCFLGVKLTIVAKPQIPNDIPFWDTMYEPWEVFWHVPHMAGTSVDSEYLLTRVLTREYLFFDTFWHSSLLEFDLSLLTILERVKY